MLFSGFSSPLSVLELSRRLWDYLEWIGAVTHSCSLQEWEIERIGYIFSMCIKFSRILWVW